MADWTTDRLEDCLDALIDYRGKSPTKAPSGIPVLSAKVVKTSGLIRPIEQTIASDYYPKWMTRGLPQFGDVVMTTEAPMGEVIQLDAETAQFALGQRIVCLRGKLGKIDNTFLRYLLISPEQQKLLASYATGTTVLGISQKALRSVPISYPSHRVQVQIGELLSALDDKIELNRRMNGTLDASTRAVFRDWFVDFGPTRARAEGNPAYLAPGLWSLFPDLLGDDGVPEGWLTGKVKDHLELKYGKSLPARDRADGPYPVYGSGGVSGMHCQKLVKGPTVIVGRKGTVGSLYWEDRDCYPIDTVFFVSPAISLPFSYELLSSLPLSEMNTDAAVPGLNRENVYRLEVPNPPAAVIRAFDAFASDIRTRIGVNIAETATLVATRDALLAKLMSGAIRVREAQMMAEAHL